MPETSWVICCVRDLETAISNVFLLGELNQVYGEPVVVGRDPGCDVIIDDASVAPRHAEFTASSNHRYVRLLADPTAERSAGATRIGHFEVSLAESYSLRGYEFSRSDLPVRFGEARRLGSIAAVDVALDPRERELDRLVTAIPGSARHVRTPDASIQRWCEAQIAEHFAALSWSTTPLPALAAGRIELASSLADATQRWRRAWSAVETVAFDHATWAHVHRIDRWAANNHGERPSSWAIELVGRCARELMTALGVADGREPLGAAVRALISMHLMSLAEEASPIRPLIELLERGVIAFALPRSAMLLYLRSGDRGIATTPDAIESGLLSELALDPDDRAARLVYADHLERRGDLAQAGLVRAELAGRPPPVTLVPQLETLYPRAQIVMLPRPYDGAHGIRPMAASSEVPQDAALELGSYRYPLAATTGIAYEHPRLRVEDLAVVQDFQPSSVIVHAQGVFWAFSAPMQISQRYDLSQFTSPRPLFDRDVLVVDGRDLIVRTGGCSR